MQIDGFTNLMSNLGGANAKTGANQYVRNHVSKQDAETAYATSTWFGKIIDIRADDAVREGRSWKGDKQQIEAIEAVEKDLNYWSKVNQAIKWADLYGGSVIIPDLPGVSGSPLNPERITAGSVKFLSVLSRHSITAEGVDRNPLSPNFGGPERYKVQTDNGQSIVFHPSRVILFNGRSVGDHRNESDIWGQSLWEHLADSILASDSGGAVISALLQEAKIDVIRVKEFMDSIGNDQVEAAHMKRWQMVAMLKSVSNVMLLDGDDEWDQKSVNWSGIPEAVQTLLTIMAGAADIPLTRLTGQQAKGLSNGGDVDLRNYYDSVRAKQKLQFTPRLKPLDDILIRTAIGSRPQDIWYEWNPLWQPSDKERAETQKIRAETFAIELNTGALAEEPLTKAYVNAAIESGLYPGYEQAIDDSDSGDGLPSEAEQAEETERQAAMVQPPAVAVGDAAPRSLYVRRDVINKAEITRWAKAQGFTDIVPDLHVTITYSRAPVDWFAMGSTWDEELRLPAGGARQMETFGEAKVLLIQSNMLTWRHEEMVGNGASFDFPEYQPHITISYGAMPENVEPYQGVIKLGPEIFEEVKGD
jgi:phage-related protein (TIGR01555 family)